MEEVEHPLRKVACNVNLEPGSIGGNDKYPLVKRVPIIIVECGTYRRFYTDDGLLLGIVSSVHLPEIKE